MSRRGRNVLGSSSSLSSLGSSEERPTLLEMMPTLTEGLSDKPEPRRHDPQLEAQLNALQAENQALQGGIVVRPDGFITWRGIALDSRGFASLEGVEFEDWAELGQLLSRMDTVTQWLIGDWFIYGEGRQAAWGQRYEEAMQLLGLDYGTLANYASVSRKVPFSLRSEKLSHAHHRVVSALSPDEMAYWLGRAQAEGLSVAQLREAMRQARTAQLPATTWDDKPLARLEKTYLSKRRWHKLPVHQRRQIHERLLKMVHQLEQWGVDE